MDKQIVANLCDNIPLTTEKGHASDIWNDIEGA